MMDRIFEALTSEKRRQILRLVHCRELRAGEIAERFKVSRPAVSQHIHVLLEAGLLDVRRQGTSRFYKARPDRLDELRVYLREFWMQGLQNSKDIVEQDAHDENKYR